MHPIITLHSASDRKVSQPTGLQPFELTRLPATLKEQRPHSLAPWDLELQIFQFARSQTFSCSRAAMRLFSGGWEENRRRSQLWADLLLILKALREAARSSMTPLPSMICLRRRS